jgi:hypothetical protein
MTEYIGDMRLFRKKSESQSDHQEYLTELITSIRQAKREEIEQMDEKPGLHSFIEDEYYPGGKPTGTGKAPPGVADSTGPSDVSSSDAEAVADLEAYLSSLEAAEQLAQQQADEDQSSQTA